MGVVSQLRFGSVIWIQCCRPCSFAKFVRRNNCAELELLPVGRSHQQMSQRCGAGRVNSALRQTYNIDSTVAGTDNLSCVAANHCRRITVHAFGKLS